MRIWFFSLSICVFLSAAQPGLTDAGEEWNLFVKQREIDLAALRACIDTDEFRKTGTACAGLTVPECHVRLNESEIPVSRVAQDRCWDDELRIWDLLYAESVELALTGALYLDRDGFYNGSQRSGNLELFLRTEAGWLGQIKNQCELEGAHWSGGTAGSTTWFQCRINLLAERVSDLRNLGLTKYVR